MFRHRHFYLTWLGIGLLLNQSQADEATRTLPASVDLRPQLAEWGLAARSQGQRPTCSVFAFTGALEFALAKRAATGERLSAEYLNWAANQTGRHVRDGGFFSELWRGFEQQGICADREMPYQTEFDAKATPNATARADAKSKLALGLQLHWLKAWNVQTGLSSNEFTAIKQTLAAGWPVCGGLRWPSRERWKDEVLQMAAPEEVFDGHSVLFVGYRDETQQPGGGIFIFRNSSHSARDGYMPYAYAQAYLNDAAWIESKPPSPAELK